MVWLLKNCKMVMTDSGGLQKEAYFFGKYCVTMRNETEWVELVENGFNLLAGSDHDRILQSVKELQEKGQACFENRLWKRGCGGKSTKGVTNGIRNEVFIFIHHFRFRNSPEYLTCVSFL